MPGAAHVAALGARLDIEHETLPVTVGQEPHRPTDESRAQVEALASFGVPQPDIAMYLDICPKTLRKYYRRELDTGAITANAKVAERLFKSAMEGVPVSMIFWLKTRAGWRETAQPAAPDKDALPATITIEQTDARKAEPPAN